jgi:hypothetical protein
MVESNNDDVVHDADGANDVDMAGTPPEALPVQCVCVCVCVCMYDWVMYVCVREVQLL